MSSEPAIEARRRVGSLLGRVALLLTGSLLATFSYAVTIQARIGLGPLFVLQDGISKRAGINIGASVIAVGFALVFVAAGLRSWPGPGTLALPILGGVALEAFLPRIPVLHGWPLRLAAVVIATWMMALAGALMIRASVGVSAYDAVMLGLHRLLGRPLGPTRLAMEATALLAGWLLGGSVGVGTVITGLLIGPGLQFWMRTIGPRTRPVPSTAGDLESAPARRGQVPRRAWRNLRPAFARSSATPAVADVAE